MKSEVPRTVAVVGNGIMGHGIAQVFAAAGSSVHLIGHRSESLQSSLRSIATSLDMFEQHGLLSAEEARAALQRVVVGTDIEVAATAELVIEAVPEDMELKLFIFNRLDAICPLATVLASSSGHPASALHGRLKHRERVIATHFWYPPQLLPLVEVCGSSETSPEVVAYTMACLRAVGKEPVLIEREVPGFIGNRIQFAALREAWSLWAAGVASAEAIDSVVRHSIGRRLGVTGPLETADLGGLDTFYHFARFLQPSLDTAPLPPDAIETLVLAGYRGAANGRGISDWPAGRNEERLAARQLELIRWLKADREAAAAKPKAEPSVTNTEPSNAAS